MQVTMFSDSPIPSLRVVVVVRLNLGYMRAGLTDRRRVCGGMIARNFGSREIPLPRSRFSTF